MSASLQVGDPEVAIHDPIGSRKQTAEKLRKTYRDADRKPYATLGFA